MKNFRKFTALLIALMMVFAMAVPAMAETVDLEVTGLQAGDTVTLYKIASVDENGVITPTSANGVEVTMDGTDTQKVVLIPESAAGAGDALELTILAPTADEINKITAVAQSSAKPFGAGETGAATKVGTTDAYHYVKTVNDGGIYVAQIVNVNGDTIYNPVLLAANVVNGQLVTSSPVNQLGNYRTGEAKHTSTSIDKEITGGIVLDATDGNDTTDDGKTTVANDPWEATDGKKTVDNKDDIIKYAVRIVMPTYPENATNKSLWMTDDLDPGVDYVKSLTDRTVITDVTAGAVKVNDVPVDANGYFKKTVDGNELTLGKITYENGRKFRIVFDYDALKATGATNIDIEYYGALNDNCEIGKIPNENRVNYWFSKNPSNGNGYDVDSTPTPGSDYGHDEDEAVVYTLKIGLVKTNEAEDTLLDDAEFDVYDFEPTAEQLKDAAWVAANRLNTESLVSVNGIVEYPKTVAKGDYWFVETKAPSGYSLNATPVKVSPTLASATYTKTAKEYTSDVNEVDTTKGGSTTQAGWLKDGKFYAMADKPNGIEYDGDNGDVAEVYPAYVKCVVKTVITTTPVADETSQIGYEFGSLKNTSTIGLPSTGGIGTYIFTVVGVALLAVASFMLIFKRRKAEK